MVVASKKQTRVIKIGPQDHGRRMSLDDFDRAVTTDGETLELARGLIEARRFPYLTHGKTIHEIAKSFSAYESAFPRVINYSGGRQDARILIAKLESERRPDWSIYLREPPVHDESPWSEWTPEIVIEVISESTWNQDYYDKPPEYAAVGIREYWLVDPIQQIITIKTRWRGLWKDRILKPGQSYTTQLLPGFKLDARKILSAGK